MSPAVRASGLGALASSAEPPGGLGAFRACDSASGRASASLRCSSTGMMARSTKRFPTCFDRAYLADQLKCGPCLRFPTETMGRAPWAIEQARCLPPYSRIKFFVLSKLISGFWNSQDGMVTKSYVFSREVLVEKVLGADSRDTPTARLGPRITLASAAESRCCS